MNIKINTMEDLDKNLNKLPIQAIRDIDKRIKDWMCCEGSSIDDPYIKQQFRYAENLINGR
ncbi:hypothetical protein KM792_13690 [Clostridium tyrobutyricum]|uniref:DUF6877 family protein n=1 Tax=Clostridium tyrobutyricum TaxID=1519 RepID=UPI0010AA883F|nr:DUF6877 family protein [Clostridium tyrobutyricum]MBV4450697.1 hypothetical protein [Clostridium tyrobutyricum]QCH28494.1 hypothetical protein EZN00_02098 [Clostridium tyrobutyricum]